MHDDLRPETLAVTAGRPPRTPGEPLNTPITPGSNFHAGGEVEYAREGNPGWAALEEAVGELEGGHAVAFASGLAAATAVMDELPLGTRVIAQRAPYFGVTQLLRERDRQGRLTLEADDALSADGLAATIDGAGLVWIESPTNPSLDVVDCPR
jgi:cystathionine gamma-synthase